MLKKVTNAQKRAVAFCENILKIKYKYSLDDYEAVSKFLDKHLNRASEKYEKILDRRTSRLKNFYERYGGILERNKNRRG